MYITEPFALPDNIEKPRFYSPLAETSPSASGNLPHWEQTGKTVFVTFRLADSLPQEKLSEWQALESEWMTRNPPPWSFETQCQHDHLISAEMEGWLDKGYGDCFLRDTMARTAVENAITHFDGVRYRLYAYVVMPNHVHACFMPLNGFRISQILHTWKSYSANAVNKVLNRTGKVWQKEYFDRYIRNESHFERVIRYIRRNNTALAWIAASV